jgi:hypothetical protein
MIVTVSREHRSPFHVTGTNHTVTVDVSGELIHDAEAELRAHMVPPVGLSTHGVPAARPAVGEPLHRERTLHRQVGRRTREPMSMTFMPHDRQGDRSPFRPRARRAADHDPRRARARLTRAAARCRMDVRAAGPRCAPASASGAGSQLLFGLAGGPALTVAKT